MTLSPRKIVIGSDSRVSPLIPITQTCATHAKMIHKAMIIADRFVFISVDRIKI